MIIIFQEHIRRPSAGSRPASTASTLAESSLPRVPGKQICVCNVYMCIM